MPGPLRGLRRVEEAQLCEHLRQLRQQCHLSQEEVAQRGGLSKGFVSAVERGAKRMGMGSFLSYMRALGLHPARAFDPDGPSSSETCDICGPLSLHERRLLRRISALLGRGEAEIYLHFERTTGLWETAVAHGGLTPPRS